jgi:hypothetical protein
VTKLMIATPAYGEIFYAPYVQSVIALSRLAHRKQWDFVFESLSYAEVSEARNYLLTRFFDKTDASHLLFVDADMGFPAKLVSDMLAFDKPVIGVIAPKRQIDLKKVATLARSEPNIDVAIARAHEFAMRRHPSAGPVRNGFIEVEGCGAGILVIERSCVAELLRKMPEISDEASSGRTPLTKELPRLIRAFDPLVREDGARLSEDYAFCQRWRGVCGGEIWANITHQITHVGLHHFAASYADRGPAEPRVIIAPTKGATLKGKISAANGAKQARDAARGRPESRPVTIRVRDKRH